MTNSSPLFAFGDRKEAPMPQAAVAGLRDLAGAEAERRMVGTRAKPAKPGKEAPRDRDA